MSEISSRSINYNFITGLLSKNYYKAYTFWVLIWEWFVYKECTYKLPLGGEGGRVPQT